MCKYVLFIYNIKIKVIQALTDHFAIVCFISSQHCVDMCNIKLQQYSFVRKTKTSKPVTNFFNSVTVSR